MGLIDQFASTLRRSGSDKEHGFASPVEEPEELSEYGKISAVTSGQAEQEQLAKKKEADKQRQIEEMRDAVYFNKGHKYMHKGFEMITSQVPMATLHCATVYLGFLATTAAIYHGKKYYNAHKKAEQELKECHFDALVKARNKGTISEEQFTAGIEKRREYVDSIIGKSDVDKLALIDSMKEVFPYKKTGAILKEAAENPNSKTYKKVADYINMHGYQGDEVMKTLPANEMQDAMRRLYASWEQAQKKPSKEMSSELDTVAAEIKRESSERLLKEVGAKQVVNEKNSELSLESEEPAKSSLLRPRIKTI